MAEINVTDVMLGDWVLYEHKNSRGETVSIHCLKVENITKDSLCMRSGDYWRVQKTGLGMVKPIPLTGEILEKNGFEELMSEGKGVAAMFGRKVEHTGVWMYCIPDTFDSISYIPERKLLHLKVMEGGITDLHNLQYVHELQHILRLFGIEKEIIL